MKNYEKALFDIETAIKVDKVKQHAWMLSLQAHVKLGNNGAAEKDIKHIFCNQERAFYIINNAIDNFDVEWYKIFADGCLNWAMYELGNVEKWKVLCQKQFEPEDYNRWYNVAKDWYQENSNTRYKFEMPISYFEKIYYMHKSKLIASFVRVCMFWWY